MALTDRVLKYLHQPFPLWECELTTELVDQKWAQPGVDRGLDPANYSTVGWLCQGKDQTSADHLHRFYDEHGLLPVTEPDLTTIQAWLKIEKAFDVIGQVPLAHACIQKLTRSIHVLQQPEPEIDVSYSHPAIPFSIFVSVCPDDSSISNLRVAESILHETMHLKLTLVEEVRPLIKPNVSGRYFSPWRDELRPAQGVLHGLFVFRAILDFDKALIPDASSAMEREYLADRIDQIAEELNLLKSFLPCEDLTTDGATLTGNLLPSS
jgi:HEXXH motif-containing protein